MKIPFNKPYRTGREISNIRKVVRTGKIAGNGIYTKRCQDFFRERYGFQKVLLTNSGTQALEMSALLLNIQPGDEIIMPSFTFVSTPNAFVLRGARIVFADSNPDNPNIDTGKIEALITEKTRAIVPVHYAGIACDLDEVMRLADKYNLFVVEDTAQAIDSFYKGKPLGGFGHLSALSFHETKNINSGEGGMLIINDPRFNRRADIIWEKGTNRLDFFQGKTDKYTWLDMGSTFYPSEMTAAYLYAQLKSLDRIQQKRKLIWNLYYSLLKNAEGTGGFKLPFIPGFSTHNGHIFYLVPDNIQTRNLLIEKLGGQGIQAVFHYHSLHRSPYFRDQHDGRQLPWSDRYSDCLLRLPVYHSLKPNQVRNICTLIDHFFQ